MNLFRNLSGITKVNVVVIFLFSVVSFIGQATVSSMYKIAPWGFFLLVSQALTNALNDPESEEPMPMWMRAAIGYGVGILFLGGMLLVEYFITSHLRWVSGTIK